MNVVGVDGMAMLRGDGNDDMLTRLSEKIADGLLIDPAPVVVFKKKRRSIGLELKQAEHCQEGQRDREGYGGFRACH